MKRSMLASACMLLSGTALADNLEGVDRLLCATGEIILCVEGDECYTVLASDIGVPDFVVVDLGAKTLSTTEASQQNRSTPIANVSRSDGRIFLQGVERGRAFSFLIDEVTGRVTVAVSRDGATVSVFGACTTARH
jgi:hypothetical protein